MLLPRMKLALIFDRAFHAMADMHWRMLGVLILFHAISSWFLLAVAGEAELRPLTTFVYWYATTAYTVGYGDLSPQGAAGRLITSVWVFPGAIAAFTTVVAKVLGAIGDIWRARRAGRGDYSKMTETIILIGYHPTRTPKMIGELCAELNATQTLVLMTRRIIADLDSRVRYVQSESLTSSDGLARAGAATASRILVYADNDSDTLTATLAASAVAPSTAHIVCFFEDADSARLLAQHCPHVEIVLSSGPEMLARSARDPGSSQVISALTSQLDESATLFSLKWQGAAQSVGKLTQGLLQHRATLLAHQPQSADAPRFNPPAETAVEDGDRLFYVSSARLDQARLAGNA
jgi:voltage-gated potassium channel